MSKAKELKPAEMDAIRARDNRLDGEAIHDESRLELIRELKADRRALLAHSEALHKINCRANNRITALLMRLGATK